MNRTYALLFGVCFLFALAGCERRETAVTKDTTQSAIDTTKQAVVPQPAKAQGPAVISGAALDGQKIFYSTTYGKIKVSCASCHTDGQPATVDTRWRVGHTLVGVTSRTSTWNGAFKGDALQKNAYGATMCAVMYEHKGDDMATVMPQSDIDGLNAYFDAIKNNPNGIKTNLKIQWATKPAIHEEDKIDEKAAAAAAKAILKLPGDPVAGKDIFGHTCAYCHSMNEKKVGPSLDKAVKDAQMAAKVIRCGSGAMPFYAKDILTDQQIADVVAYLQQQLGK